jgi:Zn-dependent protease/CBS domain-containing protein
MTPVSGAELAPGKVWKIPIRLDFSWFFIFAFFTWMLAARYFPAEFTGWPAAMYWAMGAATSLVLFACVVLHEFGHSAVSLHFGIPVRSITLFLFGGVAQMSEEPPSALAEFWIAVSGPLVSLGLAFLFYEARPLTASVPPLFAMVKYLAGINLALAVFNLLPGYPLDGGRVLRAVLWSATKNLRKATNISANVGRAFGFLLLFAGVLRMFSGDLSGGLWVAIIGWFIDSAASAQLHLGQYQSLLAGHTVSQAMNPHCVLVSADLTLQKLVDDHILGGGHHSFLVNRGDESVGLLNLHRIKDVPRSEWAATSAGQVMLPFEKLKPIDQETGLWAALQQMDREGVHELPVTRNQRVIGMLSREDVLTFLRALQELGAQPA